MVIRKKYYAVIYPVDRHQAVRQFYQRSPRTTELNEILSATEAQGICHLDDHMWILDHKFLTNGTALYWDRYVKEDGRWLIKDTTYERIYEINQLLDANPQLATTYLATHGSKPD